MQDDAKDDLTVRILAAALGDEAHGDRAEMIERLFSTLPVESRERILLAVLTGDAASGDDDPGTPRTPEREEPGSDGFVWDSGDRLPIRDIGPWKTCCRMMADVDRAPTVDGFDPGVPAAVFAALGDETRIRIIRLLQDDERRLEDIARALDVPPSTLSHHLRVLRQAGLVEVDRRGRNSFYSLAGPRDAT